MNFAWESSTFIGNFISRIPMNEGESYQPVGSRHDFHAGNITHRTTCTAERPSRAQGTTFTQEYHLQGLIAQLSEPAGTEEQLSCRKHHSQDHSNGWTTKQGPRYNFHTRNITHSWVARPGKWSLRVLPWYLDFPNSSQETLSVSLCLCHFLVDPWILGSLDP